ncbi:hypothetical protein GSH19_01595 [Lactobacillus sp. S2-2]|uniref:cell division protein FtsQ/DivIB n=1 Tax=Lactobacillus sp. S2-2 TaxID=2692917 RepID=UPI001F425528|nr:cell division protein FtsQ/DivIB [Lactobacillus sp. S2-2]MCF6514856.1 hypothetical protein [Lactobacillus sp. S2-2]
MKKLFFKKRNAEYFRRKRINTELVKLKKQRRNNLVFKMVPLLILFFIILLGSLYFISPLSKVSEVNIINSKNQQKINNINGLDFNKNDSLLFVKKNYKFAKKTLLDKNQNVKNVKFRISNINKLQVNVTRENVNAYLLKNKKYFEIFANGKIADKSIPKDNLKNYCILKNFNDSKNIREVVKAYKDIPDKIKPTINYIKNKSNKSNPKRVLLSMKDGNYIIANYDTLSKKIEYYPKIAFSLKQKSIINIEIGGYSYPLKHKLNQDS